MGLSFSPRRRPGAGWRRALLGLGILAVVLVGWSAYVHQRYPTASPVTSTVYLVEQVGHPHAQMQQQVIGFLPYWQETNAGYVQANLLSELVFFSLTADSEGHIVTQTDGKADPGWTAWNSSAVQNQVAKMQIAGDRFSLSVAQQDGVQLGAFLDNPGAQQALISTLASEVAGKHLNGLNLDFEFSGASTPAHRQIFTNFGRALVGAIHARVPDAEVSIDLPVTSASKPGLYDVSALGQIFDRVIVMSYDFYTPGSDVAGPMAPMSGYADKRYFFDVNTAYDQYRGLVSPGKIVMGVPWYGYDWPVKDNSKPLGLVLPQNDANGYTEVVSYSRMRTDPNLSAQNCQWDTVAEETWCRYTDAKNNVQRQAWIEDDRSIAVRFDFARQQELGGVAIWTLGYAGSYSGPWDLLRQRFTKPA